MFKIHWLQLWMQSAYVVPLYFNSADCQLAPFCIWFPYMQRRPFVHTQLYSQLIKSCKDTRTCRDHYCNGISLMNRNLFVKNQIHVANFLLCRRSVSARMCLYIKKKNIFTVLYAVLWKIKHTRWFNSLLNQAITWTNCFLYDLISHIAALWNTGVHGTAMFLFIYYYHYYYLNSLLLPTTFPYHCSH